MNRNTLAALSLTASLSLTLAACGSGGGTAQSPAPAASTPPAASGAPSGGVEDGVLTVGMECAYAPYNWTQMDDSNGAVPVSNVPGAYANGYDVMIAQRICDANGWELEVVSTAWDSLIPALQSGTIDVAIAGQSMTADRMAQVDMAGPYYYADIVCLTTAAAANDSDLIVLNFAGTDGDFQFASEEERAENVNIGMSVAKGSTELLDAINAVLDGMTADDFNTLMDQAIAVQPEV